MKAKTPSAMIRRLTEGAAIAALYTSVTLLLQPISFSGIQMRAAEAFTVLPAITSSAIPGLTIGCLAANLLCGAGLMDVIFGTLATLAAAVCSRLLRAHDALVPLPPVLINAVVIALVLHAEVGAPLALTALTVGLGQAVACYALGLPLLKWLRRTRLLKKGS